MRRGRLEGLTGSAVGLHKKKGLGQRRRQYGKHVGGYAVQLPHIRQRTPGSHNTRRGAQRIVDGGDGIGRAFQENHGKAILRRENLGRGGADHAARHRPCAGPART